MVRVATGAIDELHGKRTVLFAKRRRSSRVKRVWRKAVAQRQRALNGAGEALRLKIINLIVPAKTVTYSSGSIFMLDILLDVLLDVFASEEGVRTKIDATLVERYR
jgi:hypothetical protein